MSEQTSFPLSWPLQWKRTTWRHASRFTGNHSMEGATSEILRQLGCMRVPDYRVVISTNVPLRRDGRPYSGMKQPADPGVAVYFKLKDKPCVLACDKWNKVECNLWAIAKHIEALRGQDRWGVGTLDQAFAGYAALPAPAGAGDWWDILGVPRDSTMDSIKQVHRELSRRHHPDVGGSHSHMAALNDALARAKFEKGER